MTPIAIAAACGFFFSPPPSYDTLPLPPGAVVFELPFADIAEVCKSVFIGHGKIIYGCAFPAANVAYVPTWETWPGTRACWVERPTATKRRT